MNAFPETRSAFGAVEMIGNGWEWTSSVFAPFAGFEPFPFYPGYSANFFDGQHLRHERRVAAHRRLHAAAVIPQLVSTTLSIRVRRLSLRELERGTSPMIVSQELTIFEQSFAADVQAGLNQPGQKELPSKYLYDTVGSRLFDVITALPEYGVTRAEDRILREHADGNRGALAYAPDRGGVGQRQRPKDARTARSACAIATPLPTTRLKFRPPRWLCASAK